MMLDAVERTADVQAGIGSRIESVARAATCALHDELALYPKPGLVSPVDSGSHADMDARTFLKSLFALRQYFRSIARAGGERQPFPVLESLGIDAEATMLRATSGINTHRGAIFSIGLLCAAAGSALRAGEPLKPLTVRRHFLEHWSAAIRARRLRPRASQGRHAADAGVLRGAEWEAGQGFPTLFDVTLPALASGLRAGLGAEEARLQCLMETIAALDDTNLAHRGGMEGLRWAQARAREFLVAGGMWQASARHHLQTLHAGFVERRLSPGGAADLLAAACWFQRLRDVP